MQQQKNLAPIAYPTNLQSLTAQQRASDPSQSVWVNASAGSGKTKVLTDRFLRLLLQDVPAEKILCLTFTKAAANEMIERIHKRLAQWQQLPDAALSEDLQTLSGMPPTSELCAKARTLYYAVRTISAGMKVQTFHSFCQALLQQFSIEAGLMPGFKLLSEMEQHLLLAKLKERVLYTPTSLQEMVSTLADNLSEAVFDEFLAEISRSKASFSTLFDAYPTIDACLAAHEKAILQNLPKVEHIEAYAKAVLKKQSETLSPYLDALLQSGTAAQTLTDCLKSILYDQDALTWTDIKECFLTKTGGLRSRLLSKKFIDQNEAIAKLVTALSEKVHLLADIEKANKTLQLTLATLNFAHGFLNMYAAEKEKDNAVDFDDIILKSLALLNNPIHAPTVFHHVSQHVHHILMDESQDTSPQQWQIITSLIQELLSAGVLKSFFAVGDEKQSIYSFQGADFALFNKMRSHIKKTITNHGLPFLDIELEISYRSTPQVLDTVDRIFNEVVSPTHKVSSVPLCHTAHRQESVGRINKWPLVERASLHEKSETTGRPVSDLLNEVLANQIADHIERWLDKGPTLPATGAPIQPRDIMILFRRRSSLFPSLTKALKSRNIPTNDEDRINLWSHLAVRDLYYIGRWVSAPYDDFALSVVLKSPLCRISEDRLQSLSLGRQDNSIWGRLWKSKEENKELLDKLCKIQDLAQISTPYAFYTQLLDQYGLISFYNSTIGKVSHTYIEFFIEQLINSSHQTTGLASLSAFLADFYRNRDQTLPAPQTTDNAVQIMTVHGSKGLQAPIVILPDTTQPPRRQDCLLWDNDKQDQAPCVFFAPSKANLPNTLRPFLHHYMDAQEAEYARLLYVALTRAQDHFIVCGIEPYTAASTSWYDLAQGHVRAHDTCPILVDATQASQIQSLKNDAPIAHSKRATNENKCADQLLKTCKEEPSTAAIPITAAEEKVAQINSTLLSALLEEKNNANATPLANKHKTRGILLHKLLENAPYETDADLQEALNLLANTTKIETTDLNALKNSILLLQQNEEIVSILSLPKYVELPITGTVDVTTYKGRIDRLAIDEKSSTIYIIDYKSGPESPSGSDQLKKYDHQLSTYRKIIQPIFPNYRIRTAIVWIDSCNLMFL